MYSNNASTYGCRSTGQYGYSPASQTNRGGLTQSAPIPTNPYASQVTSSRPLSQRASVISSQNTPPASSTVIKSHTTFHNPKGSQPLTNQHQQPNTYTNTSQLAPRQQHQPSTPQHPRQGAYADTPQVARGQQHQPSTPQHPRQGAYADTPQVARGQQHQPSTPQYPRQAAYADTPQLAPRQQHQAASPYATPVNQWPRHFLSPYTQFGATRLLTPQRTPANQQRIEVLKNQNIMYKLLFRQFCLNESIFFQFCKTIHPQLTFKDPQKSHELLISFNLLQENHKLTRDLVKNLILALNDRNTTQAVLESKLSVVEKAYETNISNVQKFLQRFICSLTNETEREIQPKDLKKELDAALARVDRKSANASKEKEKKYDALISEPYRNLLSKAREVKGFQWINQLIEAYSQSRGQRFQTIDINDLSGWFERRVGRISTLPSQEKQAIVVTMEEIGYWFAPESTGPRRLGPVNWETKPRSDEDLRKMKTTCSLVEHLRSKCGLQDSFNYPLKSTLDALTPEMKKRYDHLQNNKSLQDFVAYVPKFFSGVERGWTEECQLLREDAYLIHALSFRADLDQNLVNQAKAKAEQIVFYLYTCELPQSLQS